MQALMPFTQTAMTERISLHAQLRALSERELEVNFQFRGEVDLILWPVPVTAIQRQDELWKTTCLEVFFAEGKNPTEPYFEINVSPSGDWNAYSFSAYREGMQRVANTVVRLKEAVRDDQGAHFTLSIRSEAPLPKAIFALTAVIEFANHEKSYWALAHTEKTPNFHAKAAWIGTSTH